MEQTKTELEEMTQVQISKKTREYLASKGKKRESYDDIIRRLLNID
jgi:negative regulator of replication initiation